MKKIFLLSMISILLTSCVRHNIIPERKPTGDKFAVIAGVNNELSIEMASVMTEGLKRKTKFKVLDQAEIAKLIPGYPINIQGPYKKSYMGINDDFSKTDYKKIKEIQDKLSVNYLIVVWLPVPIIQIKVNDEDSHKKIEYILQVFENPGSKNISNLKSFIMYDGVIVIGGPDFKNLHEAMIYYAKYYAENIGENTGMLKK